MDLHFSFRIDPTKPTWINGTPVQANPTAKETGNLVSNLKFHNLCTHLVPRFGLETILGYGLKHCIQHKTPQTNTSVILD
jgi:hypothetical protein